MRGALEEFARAIWSGRAGRGGGIARLLLAPIALVWWGVTSLRNAWWSLHGGHRVPGLTVVSVGNLAVGGTGKTPVTAWLAATLRARGAAPAVLLRGYGDDEVMLHRQWNPETPVLTGSDRVGSARTAVGRGVTVAVLDDGFQHRRLAREVDLVLLAVEDGLPSGVLPISGFRETARALRRADGVIFTRRTSTVAAARALEEEVRARYLSGRDVMTAGLALQPGAVAPLLGKRDVPALEGPLAVAAVARPDAFLAAVSARFSGRAELLTFPDHHPYSRADVSAITALAAGRPILVTEKDAVKLRALVADGEDQEAVDNVWVMSQHLTWDWGEEALVARVMEGVGLS